MARTAPPGTTSPAPSRRRLLLAAVTGSGMLSGIYWTFPPIFADAEPIAARVFEPEPLVRTASLGSTADGGFKALPDVPLTPSIEAHRRSIGLLEDGIRRLKAISGYTADFSKQELVDGVMTDPQTMRVKIRHEPFSVYMKWTVGKPGQELLYVEGQNDGEMIVRASGLKGRILGAIKLEPNGSLALRESRHPVTQVGLLRLAEKILGYRYNEVAWLDGYTCTEDEATIDGRPCRRFTIVYDSPKVRKDYRKSVVYLDRDLLVVSKVENYGWPGVEMPADRIDAETLIESYRYTNIDLDTQLAAIDFNTANEGYALRRR